MADLTVKLPDGSALELPEGATGADAAGAIGPGLARDALAVRVDGEVRDLAARLGDGESIEILTAKSPGALDVLRHDAAHVMATAVVELWPGTKVSIGPPIEGGFYYDFEFPEDAGPGEDDLERIEQRMAAHIAADEPFERRDLPTRVSRRCRCTATAPSRTSAAGRTVPRRGASRRSSSTRSPVPTGGATRRARC
jgi:threonyl-tRNA synthetase